ncbi:MULTISPECIES: NRDE family protein [Haloprofundus]|uniref:NRDE family protein n=1 Tax=Haloprofundus TaxID=1911573 RepID=UPI000E433965|nr:MULTISPECIES: NRDE family protein [Haloprofundus]QCJ47756.1 NRDE family protein [Haloprofundus sp. MHR1]
MCTLTLAWQVFPDAPVVVAANRDEAFGRPSEPPARIEDDPAIVAPRDAEAGGTWVGYNEHGLFVGITNRWIDADPAADRSRGLLVRDALRQESAEDAARLVERELDERSYDGFNLVVADATAAVLFEWDGRLRVSQFDPGVHVVVNVGADDTFTIPSVRSEVGERQAENARRLREALQPEPGESSEAWHDRAATALGDHEYGVCIHGGISEQRSDGSSGSPDGGFGTRSSSLVAIGDEGASYRFADGPPCETDYVRVESHI